jgi:hypothetical protein
MARSSCPSIEAVGTSPVGTPATAFRDAPATKILGSTPNSMCAVATLAAPPPNDAAFANAPPPRRNGPRHL